MKAIPLCLFIAFFCFANKASIAQVQDSIICPAFQLLGPKNDKVKAGQNASFKILLNKQTPKKEFTFNWTVSNGTILQGQGTNAILVDTKGLAGDIIATSVEIGGLNANCDNIKTLIIDVINEKP